MWAECTLANWHNALQNVRLARNQDKKTDCPIQPQAQRPLVSYNEQIEQSKFLNKWLSFRGLFTDRAVEIPWAKAMVLGRQSQASKPKGGGGQKRPKGRCEFGPLFWRQESKAFSFQRFPNCLDSLWFLRLLNLYGSLGCFGFWGQRMPAKLFPLSISLHVTAFLQVPEFMDLWSDTRFASVRLTGYHVVGPLSHCKSEFQRFYVIFSLHFLHVELKTAAISSKSLHGHDGMHYLYDLGSLIHWSWLIKNLHFASPKMP